MQTKLFRIEVHQALPQERNVTGQFEGPYDKIIKNGALMTLLSLWRRAQSFVA